MPRRASLLAKRRKGKSGDDKSLFDMADGSGVVIGDDVGVGDDGESEGSGGSGGGTHVALHKAAQSRYLNYAMSVITSRALPDVRDGLKPVQRRILFTAWQQRLTSDVKYRKSAKLVGDVMGNYHPHGDSSIYEAMVRMAQDFSMRVPLIDGSGNFGSLDGDPAAAMRYTECRLAAISSEMLMELGQQTVVFRPSYDGTKSEPVVLPTRVPNMLVNGATGIAVGMATNIPPHNLNEICTALIKLIDNPELNTGELCKWVKGPDFPTGGQILNTAAELRDIYKTGSGSVKLRSTWVSGPITRSGKTIYITSVPYMVNRSTLVERIAEVVINRKLPLLLDIKDISAEDVRIELTLKRDADEQKVLAYLYKHTPLQTNFAVNMTCLVPTQNPEVGRPQRCELREILVHFLHFRLDVVTARLEHELRALLKRIHILEGFETVFDALDAIIKIIRRSEGKADAAKKIMAKFDLDAEQTDAILELKLYRLAKLEIMVIRKELESKRKRARTIKKVLKSEDALWKIVRSELEEIQKTYAKGDKRRSLIEAVDDEPEFSADDFIIAEDNVVLVTHDGWVKRQKEVKDLSTTRLREGDSILAAYPGSTRAACVFFSNYGTAYTCRMADIPATTGYGQPIQKLFKLKDGEKLVASMSFDPRVIGDIEVDQKHPDYAPEVHGLAVTSDGYSLRFGLEGFIEPSTRAGRKFARPAKSAEVIGVEAVHGTEIVIAASRNGRATLCSGEEINYLGGPGKGVILMKLAKDDRLLGFKASRGDRDLMEVTTSRGAKRTISTMKYEVTSRGGKGREIIKNGKLTGITPMEVELFVLDEE